MAAFFAVAFFALASLAGFSCGCLLRGCLPRGCLLRARFARAFFTVAFVALGLVHTAFPFVHTCLCSDRLSVQSAASINGSVVRSISLVRDDDGDDDNSYSYTLFGADDANSGKFNWQMAGYLLIQLSLVTPFASFESILTPYAQGTYNATSVEVGLVFLAGSLITLPGEASEGKRGKNDGRDPNKKRSSNHAARSPYLPPASLTLASLAQCC